MPKIVRRVVNHKYVAIKADTLQENTTIPFDCYIKRFDDYVIIIEAGTFINAQLREKIVQNNSLYVLKNDTLKVKAYYADCSMQGAEAEGSQYSASKRVVDVKMLRDELSRSAVYEERMKLVYGSVSELVRTIFESTDEKLPLEELKMCVQYMIGCISSENKSIPSVLRMMPEEYTLYNHCTNVAIFSAMLGKTLRLPDEELGDLVFAALLHDIGKKRIDPSILAKPGYLEEGEYRIMQRHPLYGWEILKDNGIQSDNVLKGVLYHHEKMDGSGYPEQLHRKLIPRTARIIGLCDAFDALTTKRTFRPNYTSFEALILIKKEMNRQFDEEYTDAFIQLLR